MAKFRRSENVTIQGRIINANAHITSSLRFMLHEIHLQPIDKKLPNAIQAKINSYIKPCTNGDRYRSIAKMGGGSISVDDMYTITKRYFLRQLY